MKRNDLKISLLLLLGVSFGCSGAQQVAEQAAQDIVVQVEEPVAKRAKLPKKTVIFLNDDREWDIAPEPEEVARNQKLLKTYGEYEKMTSDYVAPSEKQKTEKQIQLEKRRADAAQKANENWNLTNKRRSFQDVKNELEALLLLEEKDPVVREENLKKYSGDELMAIKAELARQHAKLNALSKVELIPRVTEKQLEAEFADIVNEEKEQQAVRDAQRVAEFIQRINTYDEEIKLNVDELMNEYEEEMDVLILFIFDDLKKNGYVTGSRSPYILENRYNKKLDAINVLCKEIEEKGMLTPKFFKFYLKEYLEENCPAVNFSNKSG